jgi:hypothetical protein
VFVGLTVRHGEFVKLSNKSNTSYLGRVREIFDDYSPSTTNSHIKKIGIERLLTYDELPSNLKTDNRHWRSITSNERWLDEQVINKKIYPCWI